MNDVWSNAVATAADILGDMLIALAEGEAEHTHEDIAAAVLAAGLSALVMDGPPTERVEEVASVLYGKLHDGGGDGWVSLSAPERAFWFDLASAAIRAADNALLTTAGLPPGTIG